MRVNLRKIKPEEIKENVFELINKQWMLITAGSLEGGYNTMTASWGALGALWDKKVAICFIRPTRYTFEFMEKNERFTLSFFDREYKKALKFCGSRTGSEFKGSNKAIAAGLTPVESPNGLVCFKEARLVLECEKIYYADLNPKHFIMPDTERIYPLKDYHKVYIGEIINALAKN